MYTVPRELETFVLENGFSRIAESGSPSSIYYGVAWASPQFKISYSVSSGDPAIHVHSYAAPDLAIDITTLSCFLSGEDPKVVPHVLTMEEDIKFLREHKEEIANILTEENIDKIRRYIIVASEAAVAFIQQKFKESSD